MLYDMSQLISFLFVDKLLYIFKDLNVSPEIN